jgi:hypothetical protein
MSNKSKTTKTEKEKVLKLKKLEEDKIIVFNKEKLTKEESENYMKITKINDFDEEEYFFYIKGDYVLKNGIPEIF